MAPWRQQVLLSPRLSWSPLCSTSFTKRLIGPLDLGLGWDIGCPHRRQSHPSRQQNLVPIPAPLSLGKSQSLCPNISFLHPRSPFFPPWTPITHTLHGLILSPKSLKLFTLFCNLFFLFFFWSPSSLILSNFYCSGFKVTDPSSNLLLNPSSEVFISVIVLFSSSASVWSFKKLVLIFLLSLGYVFLFLRMSDNFLLHTRDDSLSRLCVLFSPSEACWFVFDEVVQ